jgi:hypothetical protein
MILRGLASALGESPIPLWARFVERIEIVVRPRLVRLKRCLIEGWNAQLDTREDKFLVMFSARDNRSP